MVIDWNETIVRAAEVMRRVGLNMDPATKVKHLSVGQRQLVEIAKALSKDVQLLILDEPTAALNDDDSENLLNLLRDLKEQGVTSIMISHKLKEVLAIADTITVLRDGKVIKSMDAREQKITGAGHHPVYGWAEIENIYPARKSSPSKEVVFELRNWSVVDRETRREILHKVNLKVHKGEIVGISRPHGRGWGRSWQ